MLQISISGLPMDAAFRYALYTHGFILVSAFPTIGRRSDSPASQAPNFSRPAHLRPASPEPLPASQQMKTLSHALATANSASQVAAVESDSEASLQLRSADLHPSGLIGVTPDAEQWRLAAHSLSKAFLGRGLDGFPTVPKTVPHHSSELKAVDFLQETCPTSSSSLNITDDGVLADTHMATAYVNDALPQCLLWGLHKKGLLQYCVRDGDVPGVRHIFLDHRCGACMRTALLGHALAISFLRVSSR